MNREIKFRAKDQKDNSWKYGSMEDETLSILLTNPNTSFESICQYTGTKDIKGNDIYEHDIVHLGFDKGGKRILALILYSKEILAFKMNYFDYNLYPSRPLYPKPTVIVIGNAFDNPELIK